LSSTADAVGDSARAIELAEQALAAFRALGSHPDISAPLGNLANLMFRAHRDEEAQETALEALAHVQLSGDVYAILQTLALIAEIGAHRGDADRAARLVGAADAIVRRTGWAPSRVEVESHRRNADEVRRVLGTERFDAAYAEGLAMSIDDALLLARSPID
jgi:hypothetical protein